MAESKNNSPFIELANRFWMVNLECSLETSDVALFLPYIISVIKLGGRDNLLVPIDK